MASHPYRIRKCSEPELDSKTIHKLITELAVYERAPHAVKLSPDDYRRDGFETKPPLFYAAIAEYQPPDEEKGEINYEAVGIALWYFSYSTFTGRTCFLEDLYVQHDHRKNGLGRSLIKFCAAEAKNACCARLEWVVLDWNVPAINFYTQIGAHFKQEWKLMRMEPDEIEKFVTGKTQEDMLDDAPVSNVCK